ncbi:hypothetical protein [Piscinibacter sakaiensis]|uniref:hypothetical protein n=1 Tax=Piscinibacter sakaiensis TaxID=1547922 RepID=UPI003AAB48FC
MSPSPDFDLAAAHRFFAAECFNRAWTLMEQELRTAEDERLMVALNQASIYHWLQRPDCQPRNLSIGYWQASRIQVLLDRADEAVRHAEICLGYSSDLPPFYLAYAHEAMARAQALNNRLLPAAEHKQRALDLAQAIDKPDDRRALLDDLATL